GKFDLKSAGAVFQFVDRQRIGSRRIRMIDPLHDLPGRGGSPAGDRRNTSGATIDRLDRQSVVGFADKPLERGAFQDTIDQLAPILVSGRRKIRSQGWFV